LNQEPQSRVLDVACGEGEMLDLLAARGFRSLVGMDVVFDQVATSRQKEKPWQYIAGAAAALPFRSESFDSILCAHSLHHFGSVENIGLFLGEAFRCLRKGGRLGLIDHFDSIQLRTVMALILSPLGLLTPWTKQFRAQQLEEKEVFDRYLDHWSEVKGLLLNSSFQKISFKQNLFFFYWTAEKG